MRDHSQEVVMYLGIAAVGGGAPIYVSALPSWAAGPFGMLLGFVGGAGAAKAALEGGYA